MAIDVSNRHRVPTLVTLGAALLTTAGGCRGVLDERTRRDIYSALREVEHRRVAPLNSNMKGGASSRGDAGRSEPANRFVDSRRRLERDIPPPYLTLASFASEWTRDEPHPALAPEPAASAPGHQPLPGFWQTVSRDLAGWPAVFWEDTKAVYTHPQNLLILGGAYGASLAIQETGPDDTVEASFRDRHHRTFKPDVLDGIGVLGNPGTHFGLAGLWYLAGQQAQDERTYTVGTKLFRALAVTGVSTLVGKGATWDRVPNGEFGSFPSGHTSSTFAFASVIHHEYGPLAGVPLYGLGALVAYGRLEENEHYLSDVVMGGVLGLVVGHTIANDNQPPELFGGRIVPYADPHTASTGLAWIKPLKRVQSSGLRVQD